jgi:hypothetical protein
MRLYDDEVVMAADAEIDKAIRALLSEGEQEKAVVGVAPAGAGKSYAIGTAVAAARAGGLRVAVASPTNEQAFALIAGLAERLPSETITFGAAVLSGVRKLELSARGGRKSRVVDAALDRASAEGWAHLEMPEGAVLAADPETIQLIVDLTRRLFEREPTTRCERHRTPRALLQEDVAVVVSHNDQRDLLRAALDEARLGDVEVNTANKVQGLAFEVVIAWHPLAGLLDVDEFHLDPGRLCVMLTRHRQACIVVGRAADRKLGGDLPYYATRCLVTTQRVV